MVHTNQIKVYNLTIQITFFKILIVFEIFNFFVEDFRTFSKNTKIKKHPKCTQFGDSHFAKIITQKNVKGLDM